MPKHLPLVFIFLIGFLLVFLGNGYRHLWQDEVETAERARIILESGLPNVIDSAGKVSVFTGGREIEEGRLYRATPWGQFYAAALGLGVGPKLGLTRDQSVRLPFNGAHGLTIAGLYGGLRYLATLSPLTAAVLAIPFSLQTDRLLHNRTARYHAFLDLFLVLGLLGLGGIRLKKRWGPYAVASAIFILPQFHSLGGSFLSLLLGFQAALIVFSNKDSQIRNIKFLSLGVILPGILTLLIIMIQTRPWAQSAWGGLDPVRLLGTYHTHKRIMYGYYFLMLSALICFFLNEKKLARNLGLTLLMIIMAALFTEKVPLSQHRYYMAVPIFCLGWPIVFGWGQIKPRFVHVLTGLILIFTLLPEFTTRRFSPFHGLKIVTSDIKHHAKQSQQPLHLALEKIRSEGSPGDPVLIDWVPQYVNWYLPDYEVALMPDETGRTPLNTNNPIWNTPLKFPEWYLWFSEKGAGIYISTNRSDYTVSDVDIEKGTFKLNSKKLNRSELMCIIETTKTALANNAPFELNHKESFNPEGKESDQMVLARICENSGL